MGRDLASHDALNTRMGRLIKLLEKVRDTDMALGSDVMVGSGVGVSVMVGVGLTALITVSCI